MGLASFNRARRMAAEKAKQATDPLEAIRARLDRLGVGYAKNAKMPALEKLLNAALDDTTHGLSRRELCASLESAEVEFDPDAPHADLVAALEAAKASKTENA